MTSTFPTLQNISYFNRGESRKDYTAYSLKYSQQAKQSSVTAEEWPQLAGGSSLLCAHLLFRCREGERRPIFLSPFSVSLSLFSISKFYFFLLAKVWRQWATSVRSPTHPLCPATGIAWGQLTVGSETEGARRKTTGKCLTSP